MTATRADLHLIMQTALAGNRVEDCIAAACDTVCTVVAFASATPEAAEGLLDALIPDVKRQMRENWDEFQRVKAAAQSAGGAA